MSGHRELVIARHTQTSESPETFQQEQQDCRPMALPGVLLPDIHCFPVAVFLQGYAGAAHWKVYIVARGVQPLVICDGTTLSEQ